MGLVGAVKWERTSLFWTLVGRQERFKTMHKRMSQIAALHDQYSWGSAVMGSGESMKYSLTITSTEISTMAVLTSSPFITFQFITYKQ